jgi:quercetin dioxygenase-like cupin family protein
VSKAPSLPDVAYAHEDDLPWANFGGGVELKVLQVIEKAGVWVVRNRFEPGVQIPTHRHTGVVYGQTLAGRWHYAEYKIDYVAGTYIYEPANSVHTLTVNADNVEKTDVLFVMQGSNLNLDENGQVWRVDDGPTTLQAYLGWCEANGHGRPGVLVE